MIKFVDIKNDKEIESLSALASEIWYEYWPCLLEKPQIDYMLEKFQSYEALKEQIKDENYIYKIICVDGKNAGYIGVCPKDKRVWECKNPDIGFKYLFLSKLYLKKEFRSKGLGYKTFEVVKEIALNMDFKFIYLTVNKYNVNTVKTYEKWGFNTVETAATDIGKGFIMDDYIMRYEI